MISEEVNTLLRLIIAHLLTDFVLQPASWVQDRITRRIWSSKLYLHALVTAAVAYILAGRWGSWEIPAVIFISHLLIDLWKAYQPPHVKYFIADQLLHFGVILFLCLGMYHQWNYFIIWLSANLSDNKNLVVLAGYLIAAWPLGILIGIATEKWRVESEVNTDGLAKAGLWIGLLERFLIVTFILINEYTAVGFLIAAKSILRFTDKENYTQKKTEYVLIGTLMSFAASIFLSMLVKIIIKAI